MFAWDGFPRRWSLKCAAIEALKDIHRLPWLVGVPGNPVSTKGTPQMLSWSYRQTNWIVTENHPFEKRKYIVYFKKTFNFGGFHASCCCRTNPDYFVGSYWWCSTRSVAVYFQCCLLFVIAILLMSCIQTLRFAGPEAWAQPLGGSTPRGRCLASIG